MLTRPQTKWRTLLLLALAVLPAKGVGFSASAVVPALTAAWDLNDSGRAWLAMSVQIGFIIASSPVLFGDLPSSRTRRNSRRAFRNCAGPITSAPR
jgi:hypothetical protein